MAGNEICTAQNQQSAHLVVSDNANGIITAWSDARPGTNGYDIFIQRIGQNGQPAWSPVNGIQVCNTAGDQATAALLADGAGGAFVLWNDGPEGSRDIFLQRVNSSGIEQWTTNGVVVCNLANDQFAPKMISDGAGGVIITWGDHRNPAETKAFAQRFNSTGVAQWTANGVQLSSGLNHDFPVGLTTDGAGGAIIFYLDTRNDATPLGDPDALANIDIFAQRLNNLGAAQWTVNGVPVCTQGQNQNVTDQFDFYKHCVSDGSGGAILVWSDFRNGPNADLFAQRINNAGAAQWTTDGVVVCNAPMKQSNMNVISDGAGGIIIVWDDLRSTFFNEVYVQRLNNAGTPQLTANGLLLNPSGFAAQLPDIVPDNSGHALIVWEDYRNPGNDIYAQRIHLTTGAISWMAGGVPVCTQSNPQQLPRLTASGTGSAIIVWEDGRNAGTTGPDLYAALLNSAGTLPLAWGNISVDWHHGEARLQWQTLSENNTRHFMAERSIDGKTFIGIGKVAAQGHASTRSHYQLIDKEAAATGLNRLYYRVLQVDLDGSSSYSKIVPLDIPSSGSSLQVLRNPARGQLAIRYHAPVNTTIHIRIVTISGQVIQVIQRKVNRGSNDLLIPLNGSYNGNYLVQVTDKENTTCTMVTIHK